MMFSARLSQLEITIFNSMMNKNNEAFIGSTVKPKEVLALRNKDKDYL
jgi:hypothetical protein